MAIDEWIKRAQTLALEVAAITDRVRCPDLEGECARLIKEYNQVLSIIVASLKTIRTKNPELQELS